MCSNDSSLDRGAGRPEALAFLDRMHGLVDAHGEAPLFGVDGLALGEAVGSFERLMRRLAGFGLALVREVDGRDLAKERGAAGTADLLRGELLVGPGEARARVAVAQAVEGRLAATGAALTAGRLSFEHARVITTVTGELDCDVPFEVAARVETEMIAQAEVLDPGQLRRYGRAVLARVNPDPDEDEERRVTRQTLSLRERDDGMTEIRGLLAPEGAALFRAALDPLSAPRPGMNGQPDPRSPGRRRADGLIELSQFTLTSGRLPATGGVRPHLSVIIPWEVVLGSGTAPGELVHTGAPLPRAALERIACDAAVRRIVLDPRGEPLDVGRAQRTATAAIRAAVIARDKLCTYPTCDRPAAWSDVHHLRHWTHGGITAVRNSALVCGYHHRLLHHTGHQIRISPTTGRVEWHPPPWTHPDATWRSNPIATARDPYAGVYAPDA